MTATRRIAHLETGPAPLPLSAIGVNTSGMDLHREVLSAQRQAVVFPLLRPQDAPATEVITIEGNATDVVLTSPVTAFRRVFDNVTGVVAFQANWMPIKSC